MTPATARRVGKDTVAIRAPYLLVYADEHGAFTVGINPSKPHRAFRDYAKLLGDAVQHIANAFEPIVEPTTVWEWVDRAREKPTVEWQPTPARHEQVKESFIAVYNAPSDANATEFAIGAWNTRPLAFFGELIVASAAAVATKFSIKESQLWFWVQQERRSPTGTAAPLRPGHSVWDRAH